MIAVTFALRSESSEFVRLGRSIPVLHTGIGENAVRRTLPPFLEKHAPRALISAGFSGAVASSFRVGDVFIAGNFSDPSLAARVRLRQAKLATVARVLDSPNERIASGADAIDMETKFIAELCAQSRIPMLSLRAISDTPAAPFGIPAEVLFDIAQQRTNALRLVGYIARNPSGIGRLMRLARQVKIARCELTAALDTAIASLHDD